ncbi:Arm DNA-binding domain-containing protein [Sphingobium sp. MI1205]|uniref:Arm DNA-binding domain-containing protein n=1 Tax=Sphingobium sp. MI1205 TaxID=407020 RepID=UPI002FF7BCD7
MKNARLKEKPYKLSDRDGLYLLVKPTGVRYWRMNEVAADARSCPKKGLPAMV